MSFRWLTVFLDFPADAFDPGVDFWRAVTGSELSAARGTAGEFATLLPPDGDAYLRVQRLAAGDGGCHLDLHVDTAAEPLAKAARRARALGARMLAPADGLIIAESPGGFTFCLVEWHGEHVVPSPQPLRSLPAAGGGDGGEPGRHALHRRPAGRVRARVRVLGGAHRLGRRGLRRFPGSPACGCRPELPIRIIVQRLEQAPAGQRARAHVDFGCPDSDHSRRATLRSAPG